jgi:uracil-DNA glycosylase family 4
MKLASLPTSQAPRGGEFYRGLLSTPDCEHCILRGSPIVPPEGRVGAKIAFVGEAPAKTEVQLGAPFQGDAGRLLNEILTRCGLSREEVWITNAALCPIRSAVEFDAEQRPKLLSPEVVIHRASIACRSRLIEELKIINPRVLVPLGRPALSTILGAPTSIKVHRGGVHNVELWEEP